MRQSSGFVRAARSLTALLTVWCLGCSGYDPLIAALLPGLRGRAMVCASEQPVSTTLAVGSAQDQEASIGAPASDQTRDDCVTCGCESCYAPAAMAGTDPLPALALPHQPSLDPRLPPSIARTPLVPPPERAA